MVGENMSETKEESKVGHGHVIGEINPRKKRKRESSRIIHTYIQRGELTLVRDPTDSEDTE